MTPEFSRPVEVATISDAEHRIDIAADDTERRKLAGRFRLPMIEKLDAQVTLSRRAGVIHAEGRIDARVTQSCVVTNDPMKARIDAPFHIRFVPDATIDPDADEVELSETDCDTLPIDDGKIDLGELAAETLALALDPFPRSAGADAALTDAGLGDETDAGPFAALKGLRDQLGKS